MVGASNFEPRLGPLKAKNGYVAETGICLKIFVMSRHWNLTKKEIEKCLEQKIHEFVEQENKNLHLSKEDWLNRYLYT